MAHPTDEALHLTVGRSIEQQLLAKVESLIIQPSERTAGYIQALQDVQALMNGGTPLPTPVPRPNRGSRV